MTLTNEDFARDAHAYRTATNAERVALKAKWGARASYFSTAGDLVPASGPERASLEAVIRHHFGFVDLAGNGEFYGRSDRHSRGMRYGYVVREGRGWMIVDASGDGPDQIVARI